MDNNTPASHRVILIEDDPHVLSALRFAFETDGYEVAAFSSGEALLENPPREIKACIVIDQHLPGLSGLDTMARLRGLGVTWPAVLITTHPSSDIRRRAEKASVDIVEKPLLGDALPQKVAEALLR